MSEKSTFTQSSTFSLHLFYLMPLLAAVVLVISAMAAGRILPGAGELAYASSAEGDLEIMLLDVGRGLGHQLTHNAGDDSEPSWSPDGSSIVFTSDFEGNREIYILNVGCSGWLAACPRDLRRITQHVASDFNPAWGRAGILFASERVGTFEIFAIAANCDAGPAGCRYPRRLTDNLRLDANPAWAPDGDWIAFASDREERWNADIYLMDANGQNLRRLTESPSQDFSPAWSPDGMRLIYNTEADYRRQLVILDMATGTLEYFPPGENSDSNDSADWSPDGSSIAFVSYRDGNAEIYVAPLGCGTCLRRLTFDSGLDITPAWRP